mgnify:CR=1 FL=1
MVILGHKDGSIEKLTANISTQKIKGYEAHTVIGGEFAVTTDYDNIFNHDSIEELWNSDKRKNILNKII